MARFTSVDIAFVISRDKAADRCHLLKRHARQLGLRRSLPGLLISQASRSREEILDMDLQLARYVLNFGRGEAPSLRFSIFKIKNQFFN